MQDILKKLAEGSKLESNELEELKGGLSTEDKDKALREQKAATARILDEKKKLQEKATELEEQMEAVKTGGLSEVEKSKKELEKYIKAKEKLEAELNDMKAKSLQQERGYRLDKIGSRIKFLDTIPEDLRSYAISKAFAECQDLSQESEVEKILGKFKESNKGILASDVDVRGSGSTSSVTSVKGNAENMNDTDRAKHVRDLMKSKARI